jgi:hypothetical protein
MHDLRGFRTELLALILVTVAVGLSLASSWEDVLTVDEGAHVGAGYSYLVRQDMRLNPEHPPLVKLLAAVPLLFLHLNEQAFASERWDEGYWGQYEFARRLIYRSGNDATAITRWAHVGTLPVLIVTALLLFGWARRRLGDIGALWTVVLFGFSPTVLAHGRLVTTDLAATMGVLLATSAYLAALRRPSAGRTFLAGLALGVAQLAKFSLLLLLPFLFVVGLLWVLARESDARSVVRAAVRSVGRTCVITAIGFVCVVWPVYGICSWNYAPERQLADLRRHTDAVRLLHIVSQAPGGDALAWMASKPVLHGAAQYALGVLMVMNHVEKGHPTYWLGRVVEQGGPSYFPVVYFLKEPVAWWALVGLGAIAGVGGAIRLRRRDRTWSLQSTKTWLAAHFDEVVAAGWIALYWAVSLRSALTIGVRHLLPVYPFTILLVVGLLLRLNQALRRRGVRWARAAGGLMLALTAGYVAETLAAFPHYLSFFNGLVGGPGHGYRYVADSNLDWGQDLGRLCGWVERRSLTQIELDYFGWADVPYYCGDRATPIGDTHYDDASSFLRLNRSSGWLAVSATHLRYRYMGSPGPVDYDWLQSYEPVTVVGHSIFVYHITSQQTRP